MLHELPEPIESEKRRSQKLVEIISAAIDSSEQGITFAEYVEYCLYTPNLGYYDSDSAIFGREGDFITAPELSSHFAAAIANQYVFLVTQGHIANELMEIGAGSGVLCEQMLAVLSEFDLLPDRYWIVERSEAMRQRQQQRLQNLPESVRQRIRWIQLDQLHSFDGYIVANELFDALPFAMVEQQDGNLFEVLVGHNLNGELILKRGAATPELCREIGGALPNSKIAYRSEVNTAMQTQMQEISNSCSRAIFCAIDYGFSESEYYHPDRSMGTMICCYRNRVHDDPLWWPGLQDISCSVNFSRLTEFASLSDWAPLAYSPLAHFLLANGILDGGGGQETNNPLSEQSQNLKKLLMPSEMGERFQVLVLGKNVTVPASSLTMRDYRFKL